METKANYAVIGGFLVGAVVLLLLFALWLGSAQREFDEYEIVFSERVSGLSNGGAVMFSGISVGEVKTLALVPDNPDNVIARIRVAKNTPIKQDTQAELELVGITGLVAIQLSGGDPDSPLLKEVDNSSAPRITAKESDIAILLGGFESILSSVQQIVSSDNVQSIEQILSNTRVLTSILSENKEDITVLVQNVATISTDARDISKKLSTTLEQATRVMAEFEVILEGTGDVTLTDVSQFARESALLVGEIRTLIQDNEEAITHFTQQGLGQSAAAISDARQLMEQIELLLGEFEENPSRFIVGDSRPEKK